MDKQIRRQIELVRRMELIFCFAEGFRSFVKQFLDRVMGIFCRPVEQKYCFMLNELEEKIESEIFSLAKKYQLYNIFGRVFGDDALLEYRILGKDSGRPEVIEKVQKIVEEFNKSWSDVLIMKLQDDRILVVWIEHFKKSKFGAL